MLCGWVAATIASFGIVTFIFTGKAVATYAGGVMVVGVCTRKREGNVGLAWGAAGLGSLNSSWRHLRTDGIGNFVGGASGVRS